MPFAPLIVPSAGLIAALLLVIVLLTASFVAWGVLLIRASETGTFGFERALEPRSDWRLSTEVTVIGLTLLLICLHLLPQVVPASPKPVPEIESGVTEPAMSTTKLLMYHTAVTTGLTTVLAAFLISSGRPPASYGFQRQSLSQQVADGAFGYLLALLPMAAMMLATSLYRTPDKRNALLILLDETSDPGTILLIAVAAVVVAPLYEELMFRVILQGWLSSLVKPAVAIPIVAVLFGAIHRMPDGAALLPLAFVLGYVYDRRHSYLSVVVIHALFNATMLTLALLGQG